ncbi:polysaccharide deacetylase family protein [Streptomyces sp. NPDC050560]|uniref:polysaccharide deacetylase family protein n=1 Tax=Streptomyces sp. NPDC050560 TaxID=3365630 RepID=UPI0037B29828
MPDTSSDNQINTRRWFLVGTLGAGAAAVTGTVLAVTAGSSGSPAPAAAPGAPASPVAPHPGPAAVAAQGRPPAVYRLRPIAGDSSLGAPAARPEVRTHAEFTLPGKARSIALTFDDGPHPEYTPKVLAALRKHGVQATFFVIGENAAAFPGLLHDIAAEGHVVANHSYTHPQLTKLSRAGVKDQLGRTSDVIEKVLGAPPRWCRAPYGDWDRPSLTECAALGMEPLGWSIDTNDWARPGTSRIEAAVTSGVEPGSVILQHDGGGDRSQTVDAVSSYLPRLLERGYTFVRPHV